MNKVIETNGALDALQTIKTAGWTLFAESKMYDNSGFAGYAPLTPETLTQRLADNGIEASVVMTDASININIKPDHRPVGQMVGVRRFASVDYV